MAKLTLTLKEVLNPGPKEIHVYETLNGEKFSFRAGKKAFTWEVIVAETPLLLEQSSNILEKFVEQGIKQHKYKGGWKEAIAILEIYYEVGKKQLLHWKFTINPKQI